MGFSSLPPLRSFLPDMPWRTVRGRVPPCSARATLRLEFKNCETPGPSRRIMRPRMTAGWSAALATPLSQAARLRPEALRLRLAADLPTQEGAI